MGGMERQERPRHGFGHAGVLRVWAEGSGCEVRCGSSEARWGGGLKHSEEYLEGWEPEKLPLWRLKSREPLLLFFRFLFASSSGSLCVARSCNGEFAL